MRCAFGLQLPADADGKMRLCRPAPFLVDVCLSGCPGCYAFVEQEASYTLFLPVR